MKWEKKLLSGIQTVVSERECVFKLDKVNKVLDVVFPNNTAVRYQIYRYKGKWSVCEMRGDGFGFQIISDWDGFRTLEDAAEAILEDVQTKISLFEDELEEAQRIFDVESPKTHISEAIIEDENGQEISVEYALRKVIYTKEKVQHIGIILDAKYNDYVHDDTENEMIRRKYVDREIQIDTDGYWEIK